MIQRDEAAAVLQPLAEPTMSAFTEALELAQLARAATIAGRPSCTRQVLGMMDGVTFWAFFGSKLIEQYAPITSIEKIDGGHPLMHVWNVADSIRLQLKSDIAALDSEWLMLPGMEKIKRISRDLIALTWGHQGEDRFDPAFVHMTKAGQMWRIPVQALIEQPVDALSTIVPKPKLTSTRKGDVATIKDAGAGNR